MNFFVFNVVWKLCLLVSVLSQDIEKQPVTQTAHLNAIENRSNHSSSEISTRNIKKVVCPDNIQRIPFLSLPCESDGDCSIFGSQMVCCRKRCIVGISSSKIDSNVILNDRSFEVSTVSAPTYVSVPTTTSLATTTKSAPSFQETKLQEINSLVCPGKNVRIPFWSLQCETRSDCSIFGKKMVCCSGRCIDGVPSSKEGENQLIPNDKQITEKSPSIDRSGDAPTKVDIQKIQRPKADNSISLVCPEGARIPFFALLCTNDNDCSVLGNKMKCCKNRCIDGVFPAKDEVNEIDKNNIQTIAHNNLRERASVPVEKTNKTDIKVTSSNIITLVCPEGVRIPFFSRPCVDNGDCSSSGTDLVCCSSRCIKGVPPKKPEIMHSPSWFGLVDRNCPVDAIVELLEIKECETDSDCRPRICCPDKYHNNTNKSYCRTPQPSLERFPLANRATEPLRVFASYIQCTPPPPPIFDLFPKSCNNALDCFPNLCCQEGDKKYCRPPKRSVLQLLAGVGQRFVPADAAKRLIERLN